MKDIVKTSLMIGSIVLVSVIIGWFLGRQSAVTYQNNGAVSHCIIVCQ